MLRILPDSFEQIGAVSYRDLLRTGMVGRKSVPILAARVRGLPAKVAGLVALADLQGSGGTAAHPRLPTFDVLDELTVLADNGAIPALDQMIGITAGDLFAHLQLHKRGGTGDVRGCWLAMRDHFRSVVGVAGNHDAFGASPADKAAFQRADRVHLLEARSETISGVAFAGECGVIGDPTKRPFRHTEEQFCATIDRLVQGRPDVLVLHQGPVVSIDPYRSNEAIRACCAKLRHGIVVCGHNETEHKFEEMQSGAQVLSVHERVVVLTPA